MKCPRTVNDGKDRCRWEGDDPTEHADEHPLCLLGMHFLRDGEVRTCGRCVNRVHDDLDVIETAYAMLAPVAEASGYHTGSLPGGDALVMLAGGSLENPQVPNRYTEPVEVGPTVYLEHPEIVGEGVTTSGDPVEHPAYVELRIPSDGREHVRDHWSGDPSSALAVLEHNERDWRRTFGHPPAVDVATVENCLAYLREWMWLASRTHDAFDEFAEDIRSLRTIVTHVVGIADDPISAPASCFDCGGRLIRTYGDRGLEDDWTCASCRGVYTQTSYFLALRAHYATEVRAEWRPMPLAAWLVGYSLRQLQRWVGEGEVNYRRSETGRKEVWMPDVQQAASTARQRREERAAKAIEKQVAEDAAEKRRTA